MIGEAEAAAGRPVSRETFDRLAAYIALLKAANAEQNLISAATLAQVWERHILDSAQLVRFEPHPGASWVDVGSGAGLPGLVVALLVAGRVTLVEPRRLRAAFLTDAIAELGLADRVTVRPHKVERVEGQFDVITARAVAPLGQLLGLAGHLAHRGTVWALPKGRSAKSELAEARRSWQCDARCIASITDPDAAILLLRDVRGKGTA